MDFEINKIKYLTLIGHIQSGKTHEEINYCYSSVFTHKLATKSGCFESTPESKTATITSLLIAKI